MEEIRFYFDEHINYAVAEGLRRRGIDVLTVQAVLRRGLPDDEQLAYALQEGRVLVTMDSDYIALAAQGMPHAGIAYTQPGTSIGQMISDLLLLHGVLTPDNMKNHVEYL